MIGLFGLLGFIPHPYQVLAALNQERQQRLNVPAVLVLKERLDHLTQFVLGGVSDEDQLTFEWGYETLIAEKLDEWELMQRRATLTGGLNVAPGT